MKVRLIDDAATGAVDDHHTIFHLIKCRFIYKSHSLLQLGNMDRQIIALAIEFLQGNSRETRLLNLCRGDIGVMDHYLHLKAPRTVRHNGTDLAETDDNQNLVAHLTALKIFLLPLAGLEGCRPHGNVAGQRKHHGQRMFGRGHDITAGRVHNDDATLGGRRNIHIVKAYPGPANHLEPRRCRQKIFGNPGGTPDHQGVILSNNCLECLRVEAGFHMDLYTLRIFKHIDTDLTQIIAYQNFHQ